MHGRDLLYLVRDLSHWGKPMRRREFISLLGVAAAGWPLAARAQESGRTYRLGFLVPSPKDSQPMAAFFDELRREGFIERQNLEILPGGFDTANEKLSELAVALAQAMPDAIVAGPVLPLRALHWDRARHHKPLR